MSKNEIQNAILCPVCGTVILSPENREHFEISEPEKPEVNDDEQIT